MHSYSKDMVQVKKQELMILEQHSMELEKMIWQMLL